ncbi:MAG: alpha/beta hydrolase domain-containing protein, partial [Myxococcales bacterium]|nr:alpha/beta hydrolase domain-containing protein [Myxococcales bacterium]
DLDPARYAALVPPGDAYSVDILWHAGRVVRGDGVVDVLDGLQVERLIAYGESQSAGRLTSYVNGFHPVDGVYDGYFIHSRGSGGSAIASEGLDIISMFLGGGIAHTIRDDLDVPVLQFQTETDVHGMLGFLPARQPDTDMLRTWEVAGTAHADKFLTDIAGEAAIPGAFQCQGANDGPQRFVITSALYGLDRWIADGTPPAQGEPLMVDDAGDPVVDEHGNTLGGVRSPDVDVPIAIHSGDPPAEGADSGGAGIGAVFCGIFGSTTPFSPEQLMELYSTHEDYVAQVEAAAQEAVDAGFLLRPEADAMIAEAEAAAVP